MKQYTIFVCDYCDYESKDQTEMLEHEAAHFNITVSELESYNHMKAFANFCKSYIERDEGITVTNKHKAVEMYNTTLAKIAQFEKDNPKILQMKWEKIIRK